MLQFINIVITTFLAVLAYKKMSSYLKNKGLGKGSIIFGAFIPSVLLYFFVYSILSFESHTETLMFKNNNENVYLEFNKKNPLEMSLYNSIMSYPKGSFAFSRAIEVYVDYGISLKDFDDKIRPDCQKDFDNLNAWYGRQVKYWQQFPPNIRMSELNKVSKELVRRQKIITPKMMKCFYIESQKLPNHLPRAPDVNKNANYRYTADFE